mmetsp:Transcript_9857/g.17919  ORF Transcript_9857/g.17919 Transcript_9857/m.17919 type:complete len:118 (-) Transcript_9857:406-759(-)
MEERGEENERTRREGEHCLADEVRGMYLLCLQFPRIEEQYGDAEMLHCRMSMMLELPLTVGCWVGSSKNEFAAFICVLKSSSRHDDRTNANCGLRSYLVRANEYHCIHKSIRKMNAY